MDGILEVIRGKQTDCVSGERVLAWTHGYEHTVVELGTGDGQWLYRLARAHPRWACLGLDANADRMRDASFRAGRKPARGGLPNLLFARASVGELPQALHGVADEIYILYPWGSLLDAVWTPRSDALSAIGRLARAGGRLEVHVNASAVANRTATMPSLAAGYAAGGIGLDEVRVTPSPLQTSWARRLAHGRALRVIVLKGTVG